MQGPDKLSVYLEYVSGGSIHKLLDEYGPFKEPVIRSYTRQILSGLAYLHARNTVHRDIKGANILVDPNGEIKLADFGMAKHVRIYPLTLFVFLLTGRCFWWIYVLKSRWHLVLQCFLLKEALIGWHQRYLFFHIYFILFPPTPHVLEVVWS